MNPSPGNMRDGLLTDAMKSAGAAKKGGTSPVTAVLDYPEYSTEPGLNLQCTPGQRRGVRDGQVGAGASVVYSPAAGHAHRESHRARGKAFHQLFLAKRMHDIIDVDTGAVIAGRTDDPADGRRGSGLSGSGGERRSSTKAELSRRKISFPGSEGFRSEQDTAAGAFGLMAKLPSLPAQVAELARRSRFDFAAHRAAHTRARCERGDRLGNMPANCRGRRRAHPHMAAM